jgi:transketolase
MSKNNLFIKNLSEEQKHLRRRILEISHKAHIAHIGSCFSCVDIISSVYKVKKPLDKVVLSNGHAGVALYCVLEKYGIIKSSQIEKLNIHPDRNEKIGIDVSTGSLGQGLPIAVGMALADRNKNVYCILSDGECAEGSISEALKIISDQKLNNLKIIINANGYGAYCETDIKQIIRQFKSYGIKLYQVDGHNIKNMIKYLNKKTINSTIAIIAKTKVEQLPFLKGQEAHYKIMSDKDYLQGVELLK